MASTRNRNNALNYQQEQRQQTHASDYVLYPHASSGSAYTTCLPGHGLLPGRLPRDQLSFNPVDTESFLFGIGSTNLTQPSPPTFVAHLTPLSTANIYTPHPVVYPEPLILPALQRPVW